VLNYVHFLKSLIYIIEQLCAELVGFYCCDICYPFLIVIHCLIVVLSFEICYIWVFSIHIFDLVMIEQFQTNPRLDQSLCEDDLMQYYINQ
jgi:hypothetical protein